MSDEEKQTQSEETKDTVSSPETHPDEFLERKMPMLTIDIDAVGKTVVCMLRFFIGMGCAVYGIAIRPGDLSLMLYKYDAEVLASRYREENKSEHTTEQVIDHYMAVAYRKALEV